MSAVSMIFFHSSYTLADATKVLSARGLSVKNVDGGLEVHWHDGPTLRVLLVAEPWVREEAVEISEDTPHETELARCAARFEIIFNDLDEVLAEINTLIEVQTTLQDATKGYLFNSWNHEIFPPEKHG
jgi:hypothetical protein